MWWEQSARSLCRWVRVECFAVESIAAAGSCAPLSVKALRRLAGDAASGAALPAAATCMVLKQLSRPSIAVDLGALGVLCQGSARASAGTTTRGRSRRQPPGL